MNLDLNKLYDCYNILKKTGTLPKTIYKTHPLFGNYKNHLEAHIEADWLIIWKIKNNEIYLIRMGSHSELFK